MNSLSHEEMKDLLAPYVLGAIDEDERAVVRAHILSCEDCMHAADELSEVVPWLDETVEPVPLPDGFSDRVLEAVRAHDERETSSPEVVPLRRRSARWEWLAAAAVFAVIAVLSFSLYEARSELSEKDRVVSALVRGDEQDLHGPSGAVAKMVPTADGGLFVAAGLQDAPADHTYQLWIFEGSTPVSAGVFDAEDGVVAFDVSKSVDDIDGVAVTVEPEGGSPKPTSDPILST